MALEEHGLLLDAACVAYVTAETFKSQVQVLLIKQSTFFLFFGGCLWNANEEEHIVT